MAAANVGGALLGAVFGEVLKVVTDSIRKARKFKPQLEELKSTLESNAPTIQEIVKLNENLDRPKQETEKLIGLLKNAKELVHKCSKQKWYSVNKIIQADDLIKLNESIKNYCTVDLQVQCTRDGKEVLERVNTIIKIVSGKEQVGGVFNQVKIDGPCSVPDLREKTPGLDAPLKEVRTELLKDDGMQVIVVSAPGGAGKTTLVQKLCADDKVRDKFRENIFFVTVSKTHDVMAIVRRIFQHKKCDVPTFQKEEVAINDLERLLKSFGQKAILLVLDDVWSESLVQKFKFKFKLPNYKILVTSRSLFPQFGSGHQLEPLNDKAAMSLFLSSVTPQDGKLSFFNEDLAKKILRVCKGSPLALKVVGGLLCGKPAAVWQSKVKEWDRGVSIFNSGTELLVCLQSSLDALDEEVKECYLDLGSFPEDQRIPVTVLIDMWKELYECVDDGLSAITKLHELSNRNLVNLFIARKNASDDGYYNDHFVTQHDLLRDLIIHQSMSEPIEQRKRVIVEISGNNFPKWWSGKKQNPTLAHLLSISTGWWSGKKQNPILARLLSISTGWWSGKKQNPILACLLSTSTCWWSGKKQNPILARLLSISTDETFSSCWYELNAPEVEVVVLNLRTTEYTLPNFMENMGKLKVLIVTNHGFLPAELSNFSILGSLYISNLKRIRLDHVLIPSFDVQMSNLQKISLVMCNVGQAFKNSNFQISDAFPNLLEFEIDYCNDLEELPVGLCDIVSLKKLSITNCHKLSTLPEGIGKLVNLEELRLASCTELSELPEMVTELSNLKLLDISECLSISELPTQIGKLCNLETLCMRGCSSCELPPSIMELESLNEVKCNEETAYEWEPYKIFLKKLKVEVLKEDINLNWLRKRHL